MKKIFILLNMTCIGVAIAATPSKAKYDSEGRKYIYGTVSAGDYDNVHIVAKKYGVKANSRTTITNSTIDAQTCVITPGNVGLILRNNIMNCDTGVEFTGNNISYNEFEYNKVSGNLTNRPDVISE